jgi:hypothetical protein
MHKRWTSGWVRKPRWKVSHYLRDQDQRPRHRDHDVGRTVCGSFILLDEHLVSGSGNDLCQRCTDRLAQAVTP